MIDRTVLVWSAKSVRDAYRELAGASEDGATPAGIKELKIKSHMVSKSNPICTYLRITLELPDSLNGVLRSPKVSTKEK